LGEEGEESKHLLPVWWFDVGTVVASASGWELEAVDGEWEVVIIWIVDQEPVVDVLLETLGLVAFWNQWAGGSGGGALLNAGSLGEGLVVGLDVVDDDPPLAVDVDGTKGLDVGSLGWAQVSLLDNVLQAGNGVVRVGQDVLVHLLDSVVVVFDGLLDLVGWVLNVLQAPWLRVVLRALWWAILWLLVWVVGSGMVGSGMVGSMVWGSVVWGSVVWGSMVCVGSRMVWLCVVWGRLWVVWGWLMVRSWLMVRCWLMVGCWGVWGWLRVVWSRGGGIAVGWGRWGVAVGRVGSIGVSSRNQGRNHHKTLHA